MWEGDENTSNINTSLLPFTVTPARRTSVITASQLEQDYSNFLGYNAVQGNESNLTLAKAQALQLSDNFIPCFWDEGED